LTRQTNFKISTLPTASLYIQFDSCLTTGFIPFCLRLLHWSVVAPPALIDLKTGDKEVAVNLLLQTDKNAPAKKRQNQLGLDRSQTHEK